VTRTGATPVRLGFCEHSFGVWPERWFPKTTGRGYAMPDAFQPWAANREHFTIFGGLENAGHRDDAHHAMESFLSCSRTDADPSRSISFSITADQMAARHLGKDTRFPSLVLGSYATPLYGTRTCSLSKDANGVAIPSVASPMEVFAMLFGKRGTFEEVRRQIASRRSMLDAAYDETKALQRALGAADKEKLDQYFTSLRQTEQELEREHAWSKQPKPAAPLAAPTEDPPVPVRSREHMRLMFDLMLAAFQTDSTRVFSFHLPTLHPLTELGVSLNRHSTNHQSASGDKRAQEWEHLIGAFVIEQFNYLTERLKAVKEVDGSPLLNHCLIMSGSAMEEAGKHRIKNLPVYLLGHGGGRIRHDQYLKAPAGTPLANLFLTMLREAGVPAERFADSTGTLTPLTQNA